jgi:hypothetical protein
MLFIIAIKYVIIENHLVAHCYANGKCVPKSWFCVKHEIKLLVLLEGWGESSAIGAH